MISMTFWLMMYIDGAGGNRETKILDLVIKETVATGGMIKVLTWGRIYIKAGMHFLWCGNKYFIDGRRIR